MFFVLGSFFSLLLDKAALKALSGMLFLAGVPSAIHFARLFNLVSPAGALRGVSPPMTPAAALSLNNKKHYLVNGTAVAVAGAIMIALCFGPSPRGLRERRWGQWWGSLGVPERLQQLLGLGSLAVMVTGCSLVWTDSKADGTTLEAIAHSAFFLAILAAVAVLRTSKPLSHCTVFLMIQSSVAVCFTLDTLLHPPKSPAKPPVPYSHDDILGHKVIIAGGAMAVAALMWRLWSSRPDDPDDHIMAGSENERNEYVTFE
jgi:hypothetical protein